MQIRFERSGTTLTFGTAQQLTSSADRNGNTTTFAYTTATAADGSRFSSTVTDPAGRALTVSNNGTALTGVTDVASRSTTFTYTSSGVGDRLTSVLDAANGTTSYGYDSSSRITRITTPAGRIVRLAYDSKSRVTSMTRVTDPAGDGGLGTGPTTTFAYTPIIASATATPSLTPAARGTTVVTDPRSNATTYKHDSSAQITTVTDALGRHRDTDYGPDGNVTTAYDAMGTATTNGKATTYTYDALFNATGATAPTGAASSATYANPAQKYLPDTSTDEQGNRTSLTYDGPGNVTRSQDTTGATTGAATSYGRAGNTGVAACGGRTGQTGQVCTETDGRGNVTTYAYNTKGDLITVTPPAPLGASSFTYDALGRVATATDGKSQVTRYSYDGLGRTTQVLYASTTSCVAATCISSTYDADGNQLTQTDGGGTISYRYDTLGRQTGKTLPGQTEQVLTYDPAGNLTSISDPGGTTTYAYDTVNQLTSLAEPGGSCTSSPTVRCTTFGYNNNGTRTTTTYPTSPATVMTMTPDDSGRIQRIRALAGTTVLSDFAYTYSAAAGTGDAALTRTRVEQTPGTFAGRTTTYGYDSRNQLTSAVEKNSANTQTAAWSYAYDLAGNRTNATIGTTANTFGYNAANQLTTRNGSTTGWSHDANGNQTAAIGATTRTAAVNAKDQYTSFTAGVTTAAGYLGAGQDERTSLGGSSFVTSPTGLVRETNSSTGASTFIRDPGGTLIALRAGSQSHYYLYDGLGSVTGLVDSTATKVNSYSYDPYGNSRTKTEGVTNPFEYTGGQLDDATGLYKLGIRYYDPTLGRFTQPDPTGQDDHYTYAANNPSTYVDTDGDAFFVPLLVAAGARFAATRVASAVGSRMVGSRAFGTSSRLFGNYSLGSRSGLLNQPGKIGRRIGWSVKGGKGTAERMFRIRTKVGEKIDLFPGGLL